MRALRALVLAMLTLSSSLGPAQQKAASDPTKIKDQATIEETVESFLDGWNKHDAHAFATTFTEECDVTNVLGTHIHGRADNEAFDKQIFATVFKHSHLTGRVRSVRFLTADLAAVDVDWEMTGAALPDGTPMSNRKGLLNWVMAKQSDGSWLIEIFHNSEIANPPGPSK